MGQCVKCVMNKHEDLSMGPRLPHKKPDTTTHPTKLELAVGGKVGRD